MIYLDNAATTFPKPQTVIQKMASYMEKCGASYGRGGYKTALKGADLLWRAREKTAELLNTDFPERIVFTKNATEALNLAIKGCLKKGCRVICSPVEHNSVMRPLTELEAKITFLPLHDDGNVDVTKLGGYNLTDYDMVIINHASNVSGIVNDVSYAAKKCSEKNALCLIDASQTAGIKPIFADKWNCMIAFAGHKSPMGPQGTGGLFIPEKVYPSPLITGGTGSESENIFQPSGVPDRYESGTINMPAFIGLAEGIGFVLKKGIDEISEHETYLRNEIIEGLMNIKGINVLYPETKLTASALSFYPENKDVTEIGTILDEKYNIAVRCGLHCAPMAHRTFNTLETGTVRVSPGYFNTRGDTQKFLYAINKICTNRF